jgi:hypothetical protein
MTDPAVATSVDADIDRTLPARRPALLDCDLVMKGGITSGVVYPKAVVRVAREYQVRNVGGTSVGAIAAGLVAAAEYQRQMQPDPAAVWDERLDAALAADLAGSEPPGDAPGVAGYAALYGIPAEIGNDLPAKFQPKPETRWLYHYLFSWIQKFDTSVGKIVAALLLGLWLPRIATVAAGLVVFGGLRLLDPTAEGRVSLILGSLVTIAVVIAIRRFGPRLDIPIGVVVGIAILASLVLGRVIWSVAFRDSWAVFAGIGRSLSLTGAWDELSANWNSVLVDVVPLVMIFWIAGAAIYLARAVVKLLPKHDFGLCTGLGGHDGVITNWLHTSLTRVADLGRGPSPGGVLTFGHLERTGITNETEEVKNRRRVRLAMIGTDIRRGVPLLLPDALPPDPPSPDGTPSAGYLFDPARFREFFPGEVVAALIAGSAPDASGLHPFPAKERIPVVVAARMSMSFPILFCAVPVFYRDTAGTVWKTWISDGGIVSNFPSNLFDQSLPPWPTFGLDLIDVEGMPARIPAIRQYMRRWLVPRRPYSMGSEPDNPERLPTQEITSVQGFLMGAVNAARGWIDNSQKRLPGFAERIVAINTYPGEGGLNLSMDDAKIARLARRGLLGVDHLLRQWNPDIEQSQWRYHRWVRMRTLMRELEEIGRQWKAWYTVDPGSRPLETFERMAEAMPDDADASRIGYPYPVRSDMDRARAEDLVTEFSEFAALTDYGLGRPGMVARAGENLGENAAAVVFDAPDSPSPNPSLLLMPPFE